MRRSLLPCLAAGLCFFMGASAFAFQGLGGYHLLKKVSYPAAPGGREYFDYITFDPASRRAYLSHGTEVLVVAGDSGAFIGKITGLQRCHGIAIVHEVGRGYISDGDAAQVVVFDLKTLKTVDRVKAKPDADGILYDPASKHVFVFEGDSMNATVIDPASGSVIGNIALGGSPEQAVSDGSGMIYDNLEDKGQVIAIDSRALKITARFSTAPAMQPVSMAMDREHRRLFIGSRNPKMFLVMDAGTGKIIGKQFPIGGRVDSNVFDPELAMAACATGDGTIHIFHEDSPNAFSMVETVKTEFGAKTMALDPKTHNLLVDTADFEAIEAGARFPRAKPGSFHLLIYGR